MHTLPRWRSLVWAAVLAATVPLGCRSAAARREPRAQLDPVSGPRLTFDTPGAAADSDIADRSLSAPRARSVSRKMSISYPRDEAEY